MGCPEARLGRLIHARDPDALGSPKSRFCLAFCRAAGVRVPGLADVVDDALADRARAAADALRLERLPAVANVSAYGVTRALRGPNQWRDALSPSGDAARPGDQPLRVGVDGRSGGDRVF